MTKFRYTLCVIIVSNTLLLSQSIDKEAVMLFNHVKSKVESYNNMQFRVEVYARMEGQDYEQDAVVKYIRNPLKVYYRQNHGRDLEFLFDETRNPSKAIISFFGFPYLNLTISPYSNSILKKQHHTVFETDPMFCIHKLEHMLNELPPEKSTFIKKDKNNGGAELVFLNNDYHLRDIDIKKSCKVKELAERFHVNYYSICELNGIDINDQVTKGSVIEIPSSYAKRIVIDIAADYSIKSVKVYDYGGLFERLEYKNFHFNLTFHADEFEPDFEEYNF